MFRPRTTLANNPRDYGLAQQFIDFAKAKYPDVLFLLMPMSDGTMELARLMVPRGTRCLGTGTAVMRDLVAWADANNLTLILQVADRDVKVGTTSKTRLFRFYGRFGFVRNAGRRIRHDLSLYASMYREPKRLVPNLHKPKTLATSVGFSIWLRKILATRKAWAILGDIETWKSGGCYVLAAALAKYFAGLGIETPIVLIRDGINRIPQHAVVAHPSGMYIDADGMQDPPTLLTKMAEVEFVPLPYFDAFAGVKELVEHGIPVDRVKSAALARLLLATIPKGKKG